MTGAPLLLASAYAVDPPVDGLDPEYAEAMRAETLETVERVRRQLLVEAGETVAVSSTVLACEGSPAGAIHRLAERKDAATIVVGSSSRGPLGRMLPGAVTDRLLHGASRPVAVATAGFSAEPLRLIGVGFLERPDGRAALAYASRLAEAAGAQVRVLTVREPVADALAAASQELDLLVCGSRGYGPLRTVLVGGVSHALVRHSACPVVVVPLAESEAALTTNGEQDLAQSADLTSRSCHGSPVAVAPDAATRRAP